MSWAGGRTHAIRLRAAVVGRGGAAAAGGMLLCCCPRRAAVRPSACPDAPLALDLVADLPSHTRDSSAITGSEEKRELSIEKKLSPVTHEKNFVVGETEIALPKDQLFSVASPPRSPSLRVENYSEKSINSVGSQESPSQTSLYRTNGSSSNEGGSKKSSTGRLFDSPEQLASSRRDSAISTRSGAATPLSARSSNTSPVQIVEALPSPVVASERDVRASLAGCIVPARHEDWEAIVAGLAETERLALDLRAVAPAASWRAAARGAAAHVRSLRSRVARAACCTVGALFEHRGRALDPELEEAVTALLERCADANRFLRSDATSALGRVACGSVMGRAAVALARRGGSHRAGPVRAAAAAALARLVRVAGAAHALSLPPEPRAVLLRAAGDLLADASAEARVHARHLCLALAEDARFRPLLKEAMLPSRYRNVEKLLDKLRQ